ncbi:PAAR-like protein [uncultured Flavobacterium sp.]|mgnify:FL=1|uniref:PAAR-like protein n=1 Tax=uncultured Flavobacterium sp. TaxID=165435 RepID=UPI0025F5E5C1|nr:PAAR-like protein [uncultured Flavobacterium sp.]
MEIDTIDNEAKVQDKYDQEQKKQAEEQEQKEAEKSEHDDKYYVVHGATCVCNKAEDPTKEAKIQVTSHKKLVINDSDGKFAVTEDDKTMDPPVATYGKCTLKPSSSGNMPCAPAFGPKWDKTYDKKVVSGKTVLTEISTLQCMVGGVVTIKKHGQTNSVVKEHAENTDPAEQMLINPAVPKPAVDQAFPVVQNITLKSITGRTGFVEISSAKTKAVEKITIRKNEECIFEAKLKSGNSDLTSWIIYEGDKKSFVREQTGTKFQNAFLALGTYRVEGYGKPKRSDFSDGLHDKNYPDCSIDVEVVVNKLDGTALGTKGGDAFTRKDKAKANRLRQNFPAVFEAKFLLPPNAEETEKIKIFAKDESGNILTDGVQSGNSYTFTPTNTASQYTVIAEYTTEDGEIQSQSFLGKTESLSVLSITNAAEVIRPETAMKFSVGTTQYNTANNITSEEGKLIKWNLNGKPVGTGSSINLPGSNFLKHGNYVVEAYVSSSNAFGSGSKDEADDWRFSVKNNDVVSFTQSAQPKVGKKFTLRVDKFVMPPNEDEKVVWEVSGKQLVANAIDVKLVTPGKHTVVCKINRQPGVKQIVDVKQAELTDVVFTDKNGVKMQKASWGHKASIYITHKELLGEDFKVQIVDDSSGKAVFESAVKKFDGALIPVSFDGKFKANAANHTKFHIKIDAPDLILKNEEQKFPKAGSFTITDQRRVFEAQLGEANASKKHLSVDYDKVSWFYAHTTGIPANEELTVEVWESVLGFDNDLKYKAKVKVDESGVLKCEIKWSKIPKVKKTRVVYIQVKDKDGKTLYDADGDVKEATVSLLFTPTAVKLVENKSAVIVGTSPAVKSGGCPNCQKPVTVAELKQIFTEADNATLTKAAEYYTKYMKELGMDTCWNKAHFFAQAVVESGLKLHVKSGENFNWYYEGLITTFGAFKTVEGRKKAVLWGRPTVEPRQPGVSAENQKNIANWAYSPTSDKGKEIGNTQANDGWNFRGKGLVQLTGRTAYEYANTYTLKEGSNIVNNPDLVLTDVGVAVLSSMAFFKWKNINTLTNGKMDTKPISIKVGKEVDGSYAKKQKAFKDSTSKVFKVDSCVYGKVEPIAGKAPWVPFALKEIGQKAILGKEKNNPRISEYFNASSNGKGLTEETNWCGAFVSWCFTQAGYSPPPLSCRAAMWQFWKQDKPIYGSAAVIDWNDNQTAKPNGKDQAVGGDGHITFVIGISEDGNHYYCVGGNQGGSKGARTVKISKYSKSDIDWFVIPPNYTPIADEYKLKVMKTEADVDKASNTRT